MAPPNLSVCPTLIVSFALTSGVVIAFIRGIPWPIHATMLFSSSGKANLASRGRHTRVLLRVDNCGDYREKWHDGEVLLGELHDVARVGWKLSCEGMIYIPRSSTLFDSWRERDRYISSNNFG
jgi:hypothetical protein